MKKRLTSWGADPLVIPRFVLTLKYAAFVVLGVLGLVAGVTSLQLTTFDGYTFVWSSGIVLSAAAATWASVRSRWEPTEKWAAVILTGWMAAWSIAALVRIAIFGEGSATGAFALFMLTFLPGARAIRLLKQSGQSPSTQPVVLERGPEEKA